MYKKFYRIFLCFSLSIFIINPSKLHSQQNGTNKKFLSQYSQSLRSVSDENRTRAFALAKDKGWETFKVRKNGSIISLQGVDPLGLPIYFTTYSNAIAAVTTRTNKLYAGGGLGLSLSGSSDFLSRRVALWDGGSVYADHGEFSGARIEHRESSIQISDHATHVAGTMIAAGIYAQAKGMAFGLKKLLSYDFTGDLAEMAAEAANGLLISNHSYGTIAGWSYNSTPSSGAARWEYYGSPLSTEDYKFGIYNTSAAEWDKICFNAPYYLPVKSAGNNRGETGPAVGQPYYRFNTSGTMAAAGNRPADISSNDSYDIISTTGNAKNILLVGAVEGIKNGYNNSGSVKISSFSSYGPTDDGRIKPDIVGMGVSLTSTGTTGPDSYFASSGTSMSAPNVSGSLILLQEQFAQKNNGNLMRAATLRGLVIHTADEAGSAPGPDYIHGWGLLNMEKASNLISSSGNKSILDEKELANGQSQTINVTASGNGPLKAVICWTDPAGTPTTGNQINDRTIKLVNDLDISISDAAQNYLPWILDPFSPSLAATRGNNIRDNVEVVLVENAVPGKTYSITVNHKGTLTNTAQKYSLIVSGAGGTAYCLSTAGSNADSRINNFRLGTINNTPAAGCTNYTDFTNLVTDLEAGQTYPLSLTLGTCGNNFDKIAKVFIDYNSNGIFEDSELAATSPVIGQTGTFNANISIPLNVINEDYSRMRVVLTETTNPLLVTACGTYTKGETQDYTVRFLKPSVDVGVNAITSPAQANCQSSAQTVSVIIKNSGRNSISNIPLKATVSRGGNTIASLSQIFTGTLEPQEEALFTFNETFAAQAGMTYSIVAGTDLVADLNLSNNTASSISTISTPSGVSSTLASYCINANAYLLNASGDGSIFWYKTPTDTRPFAYGNSAIVQDGTSNATAFYAGLNDFSGNVGPKTKMEFSGGGYLNGNNPALLVNTTVPVILESARLYIGHAGKITFTVTKVGSGTEVSRVTLNVTATDPTPQDGVSPGNDPEDLGQVYNLGLLLPAAGDYQINISYENGATIFRNNGGVTGFPFQLGNIFSINGSNANGGFSTDFYYYLYDLKVKSSGCEGVSRVAVPVTKTIITQNGNILNSSFAAGNQWFLNGVAIPSANGQTFSASQSGIYKVEATLASGCIVSSNDINYVLTAIKPSDPEEIGLKTFPVPTNGDLNILFRLNQRSNLKLEVSNVLGQVVHSCQEKNFSGEFSEKINLSSQEGGIYILKIQAGDKIYTRKFTLNK